MQSDRKAYQEIRQATAEVQGAPENKQFWEVRNRVFRCQEQSIALLRGLYAATEGVSLRELSRKTELSVPDLHRWLEDGAPDEMDVEALVRVADALGLEVCFQLKEDNR